MRRGVPVAIKDQVRSAGPAMPQDIKPKTGSMQGKSVTQVRSEESIQVAKKRVQRHNKRRSKRKKSKQRKVRQSPKKQSTFHEKARRTAQSLASSAVSLPKATFDNWIGPMMRGAGQLTYKAGATLVPAAASTLADIILPGVFSNQGLEGISADSQKSFDMLSHEVGVKYDDLVAIADRKVVDLTENAQTYTNKKVGELMDKLPRMVASATFQKLLSMMLTEALGDSIGPARRAIIAFSVTTIILDHGQLTGSSLKEGMRKLVTENLFTPKGGVNTFILKKVVDQSLKKLGIK